jgi:hypothetical protein
MRISGCLLVALLASPSLASAQGLFWLVDAQDQFIGEVAAVDLMNAWVAIPAPDGEPVFARISAEGGSYVQATVYFQSADCSGPGYIQSSFGDPIPALRTGYWVGTNWLWATKRVNWVNVMVQSKHDGGSSCDTFSQFGLVAREVESIGVINFVPPCRVIRNPNTLLLDGFELGNSSHW